MKRIFAFILALVTMMAMVGCEYETSGSTADIINTQNTANILQSNQATPTDIDYSLERYNLIRRAYWVNGQREKATSVICPVEKPLGYVILFTESGSIIGKFVVDGKVSSLNSYLTPDSEYYEHSAGQYSTTNKWLPDVDGSYGTNDNGIFFFTPDGRYLEWTGTYLYSDIPFEIDAPILTYTLEEPN